MWRRSSLMTLVLVLVLAAPAAAQDQTVAEGDSAEVTAPLVGTSFEVYTVDESAKAGEDYEEKRPVLATPGQKVTVRTLEDAELETSETFLVRFQQLGEQTDYRITITDDEPSLEIASVGVDEDSGGALLGVVASAETENPVSVDYEVAGGSASAGGDFDGRSGRVEIPTGQRGGLIGVPIVKDGDDEDDETFTVRLTNPTGASIRTAEATVTIRNDDVRTITLGDVTVTEADTENTVARVPVTLNAPTFRPVTVRYGTLDASARAPGDYLSRVGSVTFQPGQTSTTIEIATVSDDRRENDEVFGVLLAAPQGATLGRGGAIITVKDDDADRAAVDRTAPVIALGKPRLRGTRIAVRVRCPRTETRCSGRMTLFSVADRRAKRRTLRREKRLGRVRYTLGAGRARTLHVRIPRTILAAARANRRLRVRAYTVTTDAAENVDTGRRGATLRFRARRR